MAMERPTFVSFVTVQLHLLPLTWYIRQSSNGIIQTRTWGATGTDLNVQNDYDGDGKADVAVWRNTDGKFYVQRSTGGVDVVNWGTTNDFPVAAYDSH